MQDQGSYQHIRPESSRRLADAIYEVAAEEDPQRRQLKAGELEEAIGAVVVQASLDAAVAACDLLRERMQ